MQENECQQVAIGFPWATEWMNVNLRHGGPIKYRAVILRGPVTNIAYKSEMITWMIKYLTLKQILYRLYINMFKK